MSLFTSESGASRHRGCFRRLRLLFLWFLRVAAVHVVEPVVERIGVWCLRDEKRDVLAHFGLHSALYCAVMTSIVCAMVWP